VKIEKSELQLESMVSRIRGGEIDLQPEFQRGEVWNGLRRQRLIDTLLRGWYVPAIHIVKDSSGLEAVLDGQQRLVAISDFFNDAFAVNGELEPYDDAIRVLHGLKYSRLPEHVKRNLNRFVLPIVALTDYRPGEPNELFFRLNQSYNLTPSEKRNALHGPARNQVKALVRELEATGLLESSCVGFSNGRLAYDDIVARTCVTVDGGTLAKHINNTVVEEYYRGREFSDLTLEGVRAAGLELHRQIQACPDRVRFNKGTLQTWLTYCFWAPRLVGPLPESVLAGFEATRALAKTSERSNATSSEAALNSLMRLYEDRAAYRVTDVSSVLIRDLVVHVVAQQRFGVEGVRGSEQLLQQVKGDPVRASSAVVEFIANSGWGDISAAARPRP